MKFCKILFATALAISISISASAEISPFDFGIKAGASLNTMPRTTLDFGDRPIANFGFFGGGFASCFVSEHAFLQTELLYMRKGVNTRSEILGDYHRNISYLQIPFYAGFDLHGDGKFRLMTGPGLGIYLGQKQYYTSPGEHPSSMTSVPRPLVFTWAVQAEVAITDALLIDALVDGGVTRTFKPAEPIVDKGHNLSVSIGLCYRFGY